MAISIYPPTLPSTQSAFIYNEGSSYTVNFSLQSMVSTNDIGHMQVRVMKQSNNRSIVNTSQYPDGNIYRNWGDSSIKNLGGSQYSIEIFNTELGETWQANTLYKIQMRFGVNAKFTSVSNFATWKQQQIDQSAFSEWSTVMAIKAIPRPDVTLKNMENIQDVTYTEHTESTLTPLFSGNYQIVGNESVDTYKFDLYNSDGELLETSGWLRHNARDEQPETSENYINSIDQHRFKMMLTNNATYTVTYSVVTINGYAETTEEYSFLALQTYLDVIEGVTLTVEGDTPYCRENGCIRVYLDAESVMTGNYVISRTSEESNFVMWEDLQFLQYNNQAAEGLLAYTDYTIESGIKYKYALQLENSAGLRTSPLTVIGNPYYLTNFEHSYLFHNGVQLKLEFNQKISSFKHTTLRTKQDTLGDRYPHLVQNGNAYYAEFPITGLISFHMDEARTFFTLKDDGYYFENERVIPLDKFFQETGGRNQCTEHLPIDTDDMEPYEKDEYNYKRKMNYIIGDEGENVEPTYEITTDLTYDNTFVERKFREKVEEFLNNFDYKLYKSPTEGNIVVVLMNVSLTPNATLGRMIFEFSATAYEVVENTIENLDAYGIIDIGEFTSLVTGEEELMFGQIAGVYAEGTDLFALVREQEEIKLDGGLKYYLQNIKSIWVEPYPQLSFKGDLLALEAERAEKISEGESTFEIDAEIIRLESLRTRLNRPEIGLTELGVNGATIFLAPKRVYNAREGITTLTLEQASMPIMMNYTCAVIKDTDPEAGTVSAIDTSRIWGQLAGVFTGTDKILRVYDFNYQDSETYRIYNPNPDSTVIYDSDGDVIADNTNFNVYSTINLYEIIKQETQRQVEKIYNTEFKLDEDGNLTDGSIYYSFQDIVTIDIEVDEGTVINISGNADGVDAVPIVVGPTGRYTVRPVDQLVRYISFDEPAFAIINYKCLTNQMRMS